MSRLDQLLVSQGLAVSRSQARQMIESDRVFLEIAGDRVLCNKPAGKFDPKAQFYIVPDELDRYASRGGLKLAGALRSSNIRPDGDIILDVGMSTGGFTDCILQAGAAKVVGVEVGHDQLAAKLRNRPEIVCLEGINARHLSEADLGEHFPNGGFDGVVMDVSFISQTLILPNLVPLMKSGAWILSLVKPQFEVGREGLGKGGIVRDTSLFQTVEENIREAAKQAGLNILGWFESPIQGGDGNQEFFLFAKKS
ncbi:TlyA family RNA methyltransferase [Leeia sp. TBRC 13508]|uniref:TlyA family RNA methyltransferase n=1 Tax=Leeia speluncae TaxID=2884804 RepID=A0ABS8D4X1_9NEIS|nr:TlyA family RNA methyltransferase [Leeia speluncae]MCB6183229.1 TlyA family RNA methyltransferase [Leeia speluncae]